MNIDKGKVALVTGADGFIGSHLVEMLVERGVQVKALAYYNAFNFWGCLEEISCLKEIEVISGDVRDSEFCRKIVKNVDVIFNLAALIAIPYSYIAPESYIETNVRGALNICQAAVDNGVSRVIQISTSEVYGTAQYVPIDENHPLQAQSPYSASKIGADAIAMSFYFSFNLPVIIARPFNTYGPRQSARAIIPTIIAQIAADNKEVKLGNIRPTRDFTFILDTCRGILTVSECDDCIGEVVNIGSNFEKSIEDIFYLIREVMGSNVVLAKDTKRIRPKNSEVQRLLADTSKIKKMTGFEPFYTLREGLGKTVKWFMEPRNLEKIKVDIYNV